MPPLEHDSEDSDIYTAAFTAASNYLRARLPPELSKPKVAVICGSGLGGLVNSIEESNKIEFPYDQIPGFVKSTVPGHAGKLVFGLLGKNKTPTAFMVGRFHAYEGYSLKQTTLPVRVFKLLGVEILIVTGASGSLNKDVRVGNIGVLIDHISIPGFAGVNPLNGPNLSTFGPRFPALSDAYDYDLRVKAFKAAEKLNFSKDVLKEVVYCYLGGPAYETRAEARLLSSLGGDIVGMSTVPEIIVALHSGIRVLGLSLVTNMVVTGNARSANPATRNAYVTDEPPVNHEEVIAVGKERASDMRNFVKTIIELI